MLQESIYGSTGAAIPSRPSAATTSQVLSFWRLLLLPMDLSTFLWWMAVLAIAAVGCALTIWPSVQLAEINGRLGALSEQYAEQERLNAELMWQISQHTNLDHIQEQALSMGFEINYINLYVSTPAPDTVASQSVGDQLLIAQSPVQISPDESGLGQTPLAAPSTMNSRMVSVQTQLEKWLNQIQPAIFWNRSWQQFGRWQQQASQFAVSSWGLGQKRESIVVR